MRQQKRDGLQWLADAGLTLEQMHDLNPCVPGEFTLAGALYVNTGSPGIVYRGTEEGTLPLVTGRWYLLPAEIVQAHKALAQDPVPVARSVRIAR